MQLIERYISFRVKLSPQVLKCCSFAPLQFEKFRIVADGDITGVGILCLKRWHFVTVHRPFCQKDVQNRIMFSDNQRNSCFFLPGENFFGYLDVHVSTHVDQLYFLLWQNQLWQTRTVHKAFFWSFSNGLTTPVTKRRTFDDHLFGLFLLVVSVLGELQTVREFWESSSGIWSGKSSQSLTARKNIFVCNPGTKMCSCCPCFSGLFRIGRQQTSTSTQDSDRYRNNNQRAVRKWQSEQYDCSNEQKIDLKVA